MKVRKKKLDTFWMEGRKGRVRLCWIGRVCVVCVSHWMTHFFFSVTSGFSGMAAFGGSGSPSQGLSRTWAVKLEKERRQKNKGVREAISDVCSAPNSFVESRVCVFGLARTF